jgi:thiamine pyrophosphate-dependent acetolactate synthase large subunit-like protein
MEGFFSPLFEQADGLLALGTRFSQLATGSWALKLPPACVQVDLDPHEIGRHYPVTQGIVADIGETVGQLLARLAEQRRPPWANYQRPTPSWRLPGIDLVAPLQAVLPPEAILSADVNRLAYILMSDFPTERPRCWMHPAGAVSMGFGLPAALGAKAAFPERPVVTILGDGGFQMCALELATAVQENLPVVVVLVNDQSLTLIKATQQRRYAERYIGVHLDNPDFGLLAQAFGVAYARADSDSTFEQALRAALGRKQTTVIEVRPADARQK